MNTTPLPRWKFERVIDGIPCVPTIEAEQARADLGAENAKLREALERLARLGNGDHYGNSDGNMIARAALKDTK